MFDLPAIPITVGLTLWDAIPIFLSIGLAVAVLGRATLHGQSFHRFWLLRETLCLEGMMYALVFVPALLPAAIAGAIVVSASRLLRSTLHESLPANPWQALRQRSQELFFGVLVASALSGLLKTAASAIPDALFLQILVAVSAGIASGNRSGVAVIPAVSIAVHAGGLVPATLCILAASGRHVIVEARRQNE
jgi:hypothetical protein